jgi:hypothetical protein
MTGVTGVTGMSNRSGGPKTPEGKAIASRNALKHGGRGRIASELIHLFATTRSICFALQKTDLHNHPLRGDRDEGGT